MRNQIKNQVLIFMLLMAFKPVLHAQDVIRQVSCFDSTLKQQADSLKLLFYRQGFIVGKEATMTMESEYEMPVIVPLREGTWYNFVFIGEVSSRLIELRMLDWDEKQVVYKKQYGQGMESNIISYSYIPKFSEYHMIKPVQINKLKKKNICGYIIMFKKV
jgi:hypothetical protein